MEPLDSTQTYVNSSETSSPVSTGSTQSNPVPFFEIQTSSGPILADESDREILSQYSWYAVKARSKVYAQARVRGGGGERVSMHRFLMKPPSGLVVHHKNANGLDNRRANLDVTTTRMNNIHIHDGRETGVYQRDSGKWHVRVRGPDGRLEYLGSYLTRDVALAAAQKFKMETRP